MKWETETPNVDGIIMDQPREPLLTSDAGKLVSKAVGMTRNAMGSEAGKALQAAIAKGPDGLIQHLSGVAEKHAPDPLVQARIRLAEQNQNFDTMRTAIAKIGHSLEGVNGPVDAPGRHIHVTDLLNAQAEAIQGLTLLVLKGQQVQGELINAIDGQVRHAPRAGMPKWIYYMMGAMMVWSMLGMIF